MKRFYPLILLIGCLGCNIQFFNQKSHCKFFYHWESVNPQQIDMEIIIHREDDKPRVTEIEFNHDSQLGTGTVMLTTHVRLIGKDQLEVEIINPTTLGITQVKYLGIEGKKLLRIVNSDTIVFKRRY